jgi:hypothetical protein
VIIVSSWSVLFPTGAGTTVPVAAAAAVTNDGQSLAIRSNADAVDSYLVTLLKRYQKEIIQRFGNEPFHNATVKAMLTTKYWADYVNRQH